MKKNPFSILSDNQKYLLCIPNMFDHSNCKADCETTYRLMKDTWKYQSLLALKD